MLVLSLPDLTTSANVKSLKLSAVTTANILFQLLWSRTDLWTCPLGSQKLWQHFLMYSSLVLYSKIAYFAAAALTGGVLCTG